jgi:hypothetical protein
MSERDRRPATLPARRPAEAPRHIRRDAGFIDENKLFRVEIEFPLEPFLSGLGNILPVLLRGMACFLLARDLMAREEPPHGPIADGEPMSFPDLVAQIHDRHVGLVLYLREDEIGVRLDALRAAVAAHLARRHLAGDFNALGPAHGCRRTDIEPGGGLSA